jgi:hypothetical protein
MGYDELVQRLRDDSARWADGDKVMCNKAADAIVQLQDRVAELEADRMRLVKSSCEAWDEHAKTQTFATNCQNRAERAEADLAAALALLREFVACATDLENGEMFLRSRPPW